MRSRPPRAVGEGGGGATRRDGASDPSLLPPRGGGRPLRIDPNLPSENGPSRNGPPPVAIAGGDRPRSPSSTASAGPVEGRIPRNAPSPAFSIPSRPRRPTPSDDRRASLLDGLALVDPARARPLAPGNRGGRSFASSSASVGPVEGRFPETREPRVFDSVAGREADPLRRDPSLLPSSTGLAFVDPARARPLAPRKRIVDPAGVERSDGAAKGAFAAFGVAKFVSPSSPSPADGQAVSIDYVIHDGGRGTGARSTAPRTPGRRTAGRLGMAQPSRAWRRP